MSTGPIHVFLPCRRGSERVPRKNVRPFAGHANGLLEVKLAQLLTANRIDRITVSSDDEEVLSYARSLQAPQIATHRRDPVLASSAASTDALVAHARALVPEGHILWTHVTSPFLGAAAYDEIIATYLDGLVRGHDSLMTVSEIHGFLWTSQGPLNYDRRIEKWPRTQTLAPVLEVNSAVFLAPVEIYDQMDDRIGARPLLHPTRQIEGMDIDWEEDFLLAEQIARAGLAGL